MTMTRRFALGLLCQTVTAGAALARGDKPEQAKFTCEFRKKEDAFEVAGADGKEQFRIRSKSGIGSATITRRAGTWPETVAIRFVRMQYLESFSVRIGKAELAGTEGTA